MVTNRCLNSLNLQCYQPSYMFEWKLKSSKNPQSNKTKLINFFPLEYADIHFLFAIQLHSYVWLRQKLRSLIRNITKNRYTIYAYSLLVTIRCTNWKLDFLFQISKPFHKSKLWIDHSNNICRPLLGNAFCHLSEFEPTPSKKDLSFTLTQKLTHFSYLSIFLAQGFNQKL